MALCRPRANRTDGKRLRERYGENAHANFTGDDAQNLPTVTEEEFMNLYAVRAGDIRVEITSPLKLDGSSEIAFVFRRSGSGGRRPQSVGAQLRRRQTRA